MATGVSGSNCCQRCQTPLDHLGTVIRQDQHLERQRCSGCSLLWPRRGRYSVGPPVLRSDPGPALASHRMTTLGQVIVPYPASNSTVRTRALHWIDRAVSAGQLSDGDVVVHGPGFPDTNIERGRPTLLVRNARRITRGRSEARLLRAASPGVYDLDDGLPWDNGNLRASGHWTKRPFPRSLLAKRAASAADRVIAGNQVLADWAASHCADVRVIPTCVEPCRLHRAHGLGDRRSAAPGMDRVSSHREVFDRHRRTAGRSASPNRCPVGNRQRPRRAFPPSWHRSPSGRRGQPNQLATSRHGTSA